MAESVFTIEDVVDVQITLGDRPITRSNVSTPLILEADSLILPDRTRIYSDLTTMITDGYLTSDPAYKLAAKAFGGDNAPREVIIGAVDVTGSAETYIAALAEVEAETSDWFFLLADTHVEADVLLLSEYAEANRIIYATSSDDTDIGTAGDTDILAQLFELQYDHTILWPHEDADTEWVEGGIIGAMAGLVPGASTLHGKTIPGVAFNTFNKTQIGFIESKNGFHYQRIGGVGFAIDGKMVSGRFFDNIRGALNLEFKMEEALFGLLKRQSDLGRKVPYTQAGLAMIENAMYDVLFLRVAEGFLAASPAPQVLMPNIEDIDINDKAARDLTTAQFQGVLAGAVHRIIPLRGYLVLDESQFV